jgi:uncharacterized transporter YbjL
MKKNIKVKVTNDYINSRNLGFINDFVSERFWCNAVYNDEGLVTDDPKASTIIHVGDELEIECDEPDIEFVVAFLGRDVSELEAEGPMTRDKALIKLKKLQKNEDIESAHCGADNVLCDLLKTLGFEDVVQEYYKVEKWYS